MFYLLYFFYNIASGRGRYCNYTNWRLKELLQASIETVLNSLYIFCFICFFVSISQSSLRHIWFSNCHIIPQRAAPQKNRIITLRHLYLLYLCPCLDLGLFLLHVSDLYLVSIFVFTTNTFIIWWMQTWMFVCLFSRVRPIVLNGNVDEESE